VVTGFSCTTSERQAGEAFEAMKFFMHSINFYFEPGRDMPERLDLRSSFGDGSQVANVDHGDPGSLGIYGPPDTVEEALLAYEGSGVDQVILVAQAGGYPHERIMSSLELFGREVLPAFKERDRQAAAAKESRLAEMGLGTLATPR
jgi:alkanesulfonate monooxygenase SsuD/methylene tetrahydromethanopterin reductase-like flavin-dependent oxidoreductase (luciferase family)